MTNMFKKSLVAAAIAGMSVSATAAEVSFNEAKKTSTDVNTSEIVSSLEWLNDQTTPLKLGNTQRATATAYGVNQSDDLTIEVTLGANYTQNDRIFLTFSGDSLDVASLPAILTADDGGTNSIELGLISAEVNGEGDTVVVYRVTDVGGTTNGLTVLLNDNSVDDGDNRLEFDAEKVAANGGLSMSFRAETNDGLSLDTAGAPARSVSLVDTGTQFAYALANWDNSTIDVSDSRESFVGGNTTTSGALSVYNEFQVAGVAKTFTPDYFYGVSDISSTEYTLTGNFGFAFDEEGDVDTTVLTSATESATTSEIVTKTGSVNFDFGALAEAIAIPNQSFGLSATVETSGSNFDVAGSGSSWTLNGSTVNVSYMPYRDGITQVINVTNRSGQTGNISVVATPEGGGDSIDLGVVAESPANSIVRIAGDIIDALNAETGVDHDTVGLTTRYGLQIVTNAPADSVEVYSAYNVGGSGARLVVNDSNGAKESASDKNTFQEICEGTGGSFTAPSTCS